MLHIIIVLYITVQSENMQSLSYLKELLNMFPNSSLSQFLSPNGSLK